MLKCHYNMKLFLSGICVLFFSLLIVTGCSNASQNQNLSGESENLKSVVLRKSQDLQWTKEIEKSRLSQKINPNDSSDSKIVKSPSSMIASEGGFPSTAIYPLIEGFTSLDITDVDPEIITVIDRFFIAYSKGDDCDSFMDKDSVYSLALFLFDMSESNFAVKGLDWIVGKAFASENAIEVPVRMLNAKSYIDVNIFMKSDKEGYKILDLEICKTGDIKKLDGEGSDGK